jgi:hypothetical protein
MPYFNFKVKSSEEVSIPNYRVVIGEGVDVFNLVVENLQDFLGELHNEGVEVLKVTQLDSLEAIPPEAQDTQPLLGQPEDPLLTSIN